MQGALLKCKACRPPLHRIPQVTHAALQLLAGLTKLRQLRWHVGDVTDLLPDVAAVKSLSSLVSLHLPSYLHGQFRCGGAWMTGCLLL